MNNKNDKLYSESKDIADEIIKNTKEIKLKHGYSVYKNENGEYNLIKIQLCNDCMYLTKDSYNQTKEEFQNTCLKIIKLLSRLVLDKSCYSWYNK